MRSSTRLASVRWGHPGTVLFTRTDRFRFILYIFHTFGIMRIEHNWDFFIQGASLLRKKFDSIFLYYSFVEIYFLSFSFFFYASFFLFCFLKNLYRDTDQRCLFLFSRSIFLAFQISTQDRVASFTINWQSNTVARKSHFFFTLLSYTMFSYIIWLNIKCIKGKY